MSETSADVIKRYLADTISAQTDLESQMRNLAAESESAPVQSAFSQHALDTKRHHEQLTARLEALGGSVSMARSFLSQLFQWGSKGPQLGRESEEKTTRNLMVAYTAESNAIATYEALAVIAEAAGDPDTETLVREIQEEEKVAAQKFWDLIPAAVVKPLDPSPRTQPADLV